MKHVWILNHYALAPNESGGTRHFHIAEHILTHGWKATIIAASVNHSNGKQRLSQNERTRYDYLSGVPFLWVHTPEYTNNGHRRILNMLAYTWRVLKKKTTDKLQRPDVVFGSSVHPLAAVAALLLSRRFNVPFIFEVRDLWPQTLVDFGFLKDHSVITWALRKIELWLYCNASRIVVLMPLAWEYIVPLGISKDRIVWIPNGVDLSLFSSPSLFARKSDDIFTLMYFGSHAQADGIENILQAMKIIKEGNNPIPVQLRLIGHGPMKPALENLTQRLGLSNVSFEPPLPKNQIPALAAEADAFILILLNYPKLYRYGISMNKLFDYLASARPIIIASNVPNNPVVEANAGLSLSTANPDCIADAILQLAQMSTHERELMGRNGRSYVEQNHSFELLAAKFAEMLDDVWERNS